MVDFETEFWKTIFAAMPGQQKVINNHVKYKTQIIYTQINRDEKNKPYLTTISYGDKNSYYYPASTIKLPTAAIALEFLNEHKKIDLNTPVKFDTTTLCKWYNYDSRASEYHRVQPGETIKSIASKYPISAGKLAAMSGLSKKAQPKTGKLIRLSTNRPFESIADHLRKMLIYSNNVSLNKVYDIIGQNYLNKRLQQLRHKDVRVIHRMLVCDVEENRTTLPVEFRNAKNDKLIWAKPAETNPDALLNPHPHSKVGKGYHYGDSIYTTPRDFGDHNNVPLKDIHKILSTIVLPEAFKERERFNLTKDDYNFLRKNMSIYPREHQYLRNPFSDTIPDGYTKFLYIGNSKQKLPEHIRIFNIVGQAFGWTIDCAYVVDFKNKIEFILAARTFTNENEILGDNRYQYEQIAFPFFEQLGKAVYEYELKRKRTVTPNLREFEKLFKNRVKTSFFSG